MADNGATFPRVHVWADNEDVNASDLNGEFNNLLSNLDPTGVGSHEINVTEMKKQTNPGAVGTEVLATSLATELEQIRFAISRLIAGPNNVWYDAPAISIQGLNNILAAGNTVPSNRIASGRTRGTTDFQPVFLQAAGGTTFTVNLLAAATNFNAFIQGTNYSLTADLSATGLFAAPAATNTCLVNDATLTGQTASLYAGEDDSTYPSITVSSMGATVSALVGTYAVFQHGTEYFLGFVESTTKISRCFRGFFFSSTDTPIVRTAMSNGDTLTLMKMAWIFYTNSNTLAVMYTNPVISATTPVAPANGDFWFDLNAQYWKQYNGSSFVTANALLIGIAVSDATGCKASRSFDFYATFSDKNTISPNIFNSTQVVAQSAPNRISINGLLLDFGYTVPTWDTALNLDSGVTIAVNSTYYLYITQLGKLIISNERPYNRYDLLGRYHPYHLWRNVGSVTTDGGSNFSLVSSAGGFDGANLKDASVSQSKLAARTVAPSVGIGGVAISASSGSFTTSSASYVDVTNLAVTITSTGRPIAISAQPLSGDPGWFRAEYIGSSHNSTTVHIAILRNGVILSETLLTSAGFDTTTTDNDYPCSAVGFLDAVPAGTYTYKLQIRLDVGTSFSANFMTLVAYEI